MIAYLQVLDNPPDAVSLLRIANRPRRGIGDTSLARLADVRRRARAARSGRRSARAEEAGLAAAPRARRCSGCARCCSRCMSAAQERRVPELVEACSSAPATSRRSRRSGRSRRAAGIENLEELVGVAREYQRGAPSEPSLSSFLQEISLYSDQDAMRGEEDGGLVTLMTLHNAKGLEFRAVFMIGMEDGIFPHSRSIEENDIEEERRLCYVGMTRAKERLTMTHAIAPLALRPQRHEPAVALPRRAARGRRRARAAAAGVVVELRRAAVEPVRAARASCPSSRPATRCATTRSARHRHARSSPAASSPCASRTAPSGG